ncbi:MAG: hypothetical protein QNK23_14420 [Crocinitomicaceae bacterium]|nr:hypothetical protein [Crocinitomicaceae bacterium]
MSTTEKVMQDFQNKLRIEITKYFNSINRFDSKYILNSSFTAGSTFEKTTFCSEFRFYNVHELPVPAIIFGDVHEVSIEGEVKVATSTRPPKSGKELDSWTSTLFGISIFTEVSFDNDEKVININNLVIRNR